MMKKIYALIIVALIVSLAALAVWWKMSPVADRVETQPAKISDLSTMVQLCTLDFYEDVPLKATKGPRHFMGKMTVTGSITFDLEKIRQSQRGDTLVVVLPPEIITVNESTDDGAYRVIDTWSDRFLGSSNFTAAEVNEIKRKTIESYRRKLYREGRVAEARRQARLNLASLLETATSRPALVLD